MIEVKYFKKKALTKSLIINNYIYFTTNTKILGLSIRAIEIETQYNSEYITSVVSFATILNQKNEHNLRYVFVEFRRNSRAEK